MIAKYNRLSFAFGIPGLIVQLVGTFQRVPGGPRTPPTPTGAVLVLAGTALLLVGLAYYAKAKGRHPAWCLLALLSIIGLIVLAVLKDRTGSARPAEVEQTQA